MKFLNKKEQVIDLEITPYGKHLLSKGVFKPEFYAFYDDETIYDSQYGGFNEVQNSASVRINEAVQLETQANFSSIENHSRQSTSFRRATRRITPEKNFNNRPLGRSSIAKSKLPGWNIKALKGTIANSVQHYSGSDKTYNIPQINFDDVICNLEISEQLSENTETFYLFQSNNKLNNKLLKFDSDSIVLEIDEQNTDFDWENFDLEVFEVEVNTQSNTGGTTRREEILKPLYHRDKIITVKNDILLDKPESTGRNTSTDPNYIDYYFDIFVDNEIDEEELCDLRPEDKPLGVFSKRQIDCDDIQEQNFEDVDALYDTEEFDGECE